MDGKVVVVTGGGRGIGRAICLAARARGHRVFAAMRQPEACSLPPEIERVRLDVTDRASVGEAIEWIEKEAGQIDVAINNAGVGLFAPVELISDEELQQVLEVNTFGPMRVAQAVLPAMRRRRSGTIITITSTAGLRARVGGGCYDCSKHGTEALMMSLAAQVRPFGIRVALVEPGPTATSMLQTIRLGSRVSDEGIYGSLKRWYEANMPRRLREGQPAAEVGDFVVDLFESGSPNLRNQPSDYARQVAAETLVDPTGNSWLEKQHVP